MDKADAALWCGPHLYLGLLQRCIPAEDLRGRAGVPQKGFSDTRKLLISSGQPVFVFPILSASAEHLLHKLRGVLPDITHTEPHRKGQ